jgi:hypothetical protein
MPDAPSDPYKVILLLKAKEEMRAARSRAKNDEDVRQYLALVREVIAQIAANPLTWGERWGRYPHADLAQFHKLYQRISTIYAVDETHRIVYVAHCRPVLNHPLASE